MWYTCSFVDDTVRRLNGGNAPRTMSSTEGPGTPAQNEEHPAAVALPWWKWRRDHAVVEVRYGDADEVDEEDDFDCEDDDEYGGGVSRDVRKVMS
jgi:hypothetical protein